MLFVFLLALVSAQLPPVPFTAPTAACASYKTACEADVACAYLSNAVDACVAALGIDSAAVPGIPNHEVGFGYATCAYSMNTFAGKSAGTGETDMTSISPWDTMVTPWMPHMLGDLYECECRNAYAAPCDWDQAAALAVSISTCQQDANGVCETIWAEIVSESADNGAVWDTNPFLVGMDFPSNTNSNDGYCEIFFKVLEKENVKAAHLGVASFVFGMTNGNEVVAHCNEMIVKRVGGLVLGVGFGSFFGGLILTLVSVCVYHKCCGSKD